MFQPIPIDEERRYSFTSELNLKKRKELEKKSSLLNNNFENLLEEEIEEHAKTAMASFTRIIKKISSNSLFDCVLDGLERQGKSMKYVDDLFPASLKSLIPNETHHRKQWKSIQWMRPSDFLKDDYRLFPIDKLTVKQGLAPLGSSYLISPLLSLVENPENFRRLFTLQIGEFTEAQTIELCKKFGIYCCVLLDRGVPTQVIIDDFIPCTTSAEGSAPAFTHSPNNELFVVLLEKAYAKLYGSYFNIDSGLIIEAISSLVEAPVRRLFFDKKYTWDVIVEGTKKKWPMLANIKGEDSLDKSSGLEFSASVILLRSTEFSHQEKTIRMLTFKSTIYKMDYKGPWNKNDSRWNEVTISKNDYIDESQGIFSIPFEDSLKFFETCYFLKLVENYKYTYYVDKHAHIHHGEFYYFKVKKKGIYYISAYQDTGRKATKLKGAISKLPEITMVLAKITKNEYVYIGGRQKDTAQVSAFITNDKIQTEKELDEGDYILYLRGRETPGTTWNKYVTIGIYGPKKTSIYQLVRKQYGDFLERTYLNYMRENFCNYPQNTVDLSDPNFKLLTAKYIPRNREGYGLLYVKNNELNTLSCSFKFKNLTASKARLKKPFGGKNIAEFDLNSGEDRVVLVKVGEKQGLSGDNDVLVSRKITIKN